MGVALVRELQSEGHVLAVAKILKTNLVLLLAGGQEFSYPGNEIRQLLDEPQLAQALGSEETYQVQSVRDQLSMSTNDERIIVEDLSGKNPCESGFAEKAAALVRVLRDAGLEQYTALGTNCSIEREDERSDSPMAGAIADAALNRERLEASLDGTIRGAGVTIYSDVDGDRLKLTLEPRRQDLDTPVLFAQLNIHTDDVDTDEVIDQERLRARLCRTYESVLQMSQTVISST